MPRLAREDPPAPGRDSARLAPLITTRLASPKATGLLDPVEGRRAFSGHIVRVVYGLALCVLGLYLFWSFGRQFFFLEGPGTIMARRQAVTVPFNGRISRIDVIPGSRVEEGDPLFKYSSIDVQNQIATLLTSISDQIAREGELEVRLAVARETRNSAAKRSALASEAVRRLEKLPAGLFSFQEKLPIYRDATNAEQDVARAKAEIATLEQLLAALHKISTDLKSKKKEIEDLYNSGREVAPITGVVGSRAPSKGDAIIAGAPVLDIYDLRDIYIDWEIPLKRFVTPKVGDKVYITSGYETHEGVVIETFPVTAPRPQNEIKILKNEPKGQIARVRSQWLREHLNPKNNPVINATVVVRMDYGFALETFFDFKKLIYGSAT